MTEFLQYSHLNLEVEHQDRTFSFPDRSDAKADAVFPHDKEDYFPVDLSDPSSRKWRGQIGTFIAQNLGQDSLGTSLTFQGPLSSSFSSAVQPKGYELWQRSRETRKDYYLYGYRTAKRFSSPNEFAFHAMWLFNEDFYANGSCRCTICTNTKQTEVTSAWIGIPDRGSTPTPAKIKASISRRDVGASVNTIDIPPVARLARWTQSRRPAIGEKTTVQPTHEQAVSNERDLDLTSLRPYRVGEIVWVSIAPILPSESPQLNPDEVIDLWPAIVQQVEFKSTVAEHQPGQPYTVLQTRRYRVHLLGAGGNAVVSEEKVLSWQAYKLPRVLFEQIKRPWMHVQVTDGLYELDRFHPLTLPSRTHFTPHNAASANGLREPEPHAEIPRTFENALACLSLARRIAKLVEERYCTTDMYKDPGGGGGPREMYQGIWWGPERIWMDDLVRLNVTRYELFKDGRGDALRVPTPGADGRGILARITEIAYDTQKRQPYFFARLYELADNEASKSVAPEPDVGLRQPGCLSTPARSHSSPYPLPPPPDGFHFRRITPDDIEIYLPVQFIAGRYDPLPVISEPHRQLLNRVLNASMIKELCSKTLKEKDPDAENRLLQVLALAGLYSGEFKNLLPLEWGETRAKMVRNAEAEARRMAYDRWMQTKAKAERKARRHEEEDSDIMVLDESR